MSLLFDVVLFIRKATKDLKLSVTERLLIFTLAGRIGKREKTWISQLELADEMQISDRHLRRAIANLAKANIILIDKAKRNNQYSLNKVMLDTGHPCPQSEEVIPDTHVRSEVTIPDTHVLPTGHPCPVTPDENVLQLIEIIEEKTEKIPPKETSKGTIKANRQLLMSESESRFDEFWTVYPSKENKKKAKQIWLKKKLDLKADLIIADVIKRKAYHKKWLDGYIPHPTTYLNGERWEDEITEVRHAEGQSVGKLSAHQASLQRGWDVIKNGNWH